MRLRPAGIRADDLQVQTVNVAWGPASLRLSEAECLRAASVAAYAVFRETDGRRQRHVIVGHLREFLDPSVVRAYDLSLDDATPVEAGGSGAGLPAVALE